MLNVVATGVDRIVVVDGDAIGRTLAILVVLEIETLLVNTETVGELADELGLEEDDEDALTVLDMALLLLTATRLDGVGVWIWVEIADELEDDTVAVAVTVLLLLLEEAANGTVVNVVAAGTDTAAVVDADMLADVTALELVALESGVMMLATERLDTVVVGLDVEVVVGDIAVVTVLLTLLEEAGSSAVAIVTDATDVVDCDVLGSTLTTLETVMLLLTPDVLEATDV